MILIKEGNTTATTTDIFKYYKNSTFVDGQNAGNRISELLDFKIFLRGHAPRPPRSKGPLSGHSCLLHFWWVFITDVIEIPDKEFCSFAVIIKRIWKACLWLPLTSRNGNMLFTKQNKK